MLHAATRPNILSDVRSENDETLMIASLTAGSCEPDPYPKKNQRAHISFIDGHLMPLAAARRTFQPETADAPHEFVILLKTNGLAKVGVRLEFIAFLNVLWRGGRGQNDGWDRFQTVIGLDLSQYFPTAHFWEI
jgi:hypothetical protein